jgi:hypothetical protein
MIHVHLCVASSTGVHESCRGEGGDVTTTIMTTTLVTDAGGDDEQ